MDNLKIVMPCVCCKGKGKVNLIGQEEICFLCEGKNYIVFTFKFEKMDSIGLDEIEKHAKNYVLLLSKGGKQKNEK